MLTPILTWYIPNFIKKNKLQELCDLTADAFMCAGPALHGLTFAEGLRRYALFTREQGEKCLTEAAQAEQIKTRLYDNACIFGRQLRKTLCVKTWQDAMTALTAAYHLLGIDFQAQGEAEFTIRRCFFSQYYSADVCQLISALDAGLVAGLSGGQLSFTHRITDGSCCCTGHLGRGEGR
jgi:hypothetical protein